MKSKKAFVNNKMLLDESEEKLASALEMETDKYEAIRENEIIPQLKEAWSLITAKESFPPKISGSSSC